MFYIFHKETCFLIIWVAGLIRYQKLAIYERTLNRGIAINVVGQSFREFRNNQCWVIRSSLGRVCSIYIKTSVMDNQVRLHKITLDFENFRIASNYVHIMYIYSLRITIVFRFKQNVGMSNINYLRKMPPLNVQAILKTLQPRSW